MADLIASLILREGYAVDIGRSMTEAVQAARSSAFELILLDRRLPEGDGLSLLPDLRKLQPGVRVIVLSAMDTLDETVTGLDAGADDYLIKPFRAPELLARIRACLRRPGHDAQPAITVGALTFEPASLQVTVAGKPVALHRRELALLTALMKRPNRVMAREALLEDVYGCDADVQQRSLDTLVWRLRSRLEECGSGLTIHLARGIGYMLTEQTV